MSKIDFKDFFKHGRALNKFLLSYLAHTDLTVNTKLDLHSFFQTVHCVKEKLGVAKKFHGCLLTKLADSKAGIPYLLECGANKYVLKQLPYRNGQKIKSHIVELGENGDGCYQYKKNQNVSTFGSQGFLNEYLIGIVVADTLRKAKSLNYLNFYRGFYCVDKGYILMELLTGECSEIYKHKKLSRRVLLSILLQFCKSLLILKNQLQFSHNDLKLKNLFFSYLQYKPKGWDDTIPWENIVIKFADFDKSTAIIPNEHLPVFLYPTKKRISIFRGILSKIGSRRIDTEKDTYKITYYANLMNFNSRHNYTSYFKSFDFYVFITSMLLNSTYRNAFEDDYIEKGKDSLLQNIIFPMYGFKDNKDYKQQFGKFIDKLKPGTEESVTPPMQFLKNRQLSCSAIENTIKNLQKCV